MISARRTARVRRRSLPRDVRRNHFVSHTVWYPRWLFGLAGAAVLAAILVLVTLFGGCGFVSGGAGSGGGAGDDGGVGAIDHPTGPDDLVFRVSYGGGFVPVETIFTHMPMISVYGDGKMITQGAIPAIYPGPALPNLLVAELSPAGIQQLLAAAREAGLFEDGVDYGQPNVADGSTTTYTIMAGGSVFETSIYHLGAENASDRSLSDVEIERRMNVVRFQADLNDLAGWLGDELGPEQPYRWDALSVLVVPGGPPQDDPSGLEPRFVDWPLAALDAIGERQEQPAGRRAVISGADLTLLRPLVEKADTLTFWRSGEGVYAIYLRPLLPDEVR